MRSLPRRATEKCCVEGCGGQFYAREMCNRHYQRKAQGRDMNAPPRNRRANGTGSIDKLGYMKITVNGKVVFEHRAVMERKIGRHLFADENVHHLNGDRSDNRPENLELWSTLQPPGQRVEDKIAWAHEIIKRYGLRVAA